MRFTRTPDYCPKCHSDDTHRSRRKKFERMLLGERLRPFRCRNCNLRFYALVKPTHAATATE